MTNRFDELIELIKAKYNVTPYYEYTGKDVDSAVYRLKFAEQSKTSIDFASLGELMAKLEDMAVFTGTFTEAINRKRKTDAPIVEKTDESAKPETKGLFGRKKKGDKA